jgi:hypothetical protein
MKTTELIQGLGPPIAFFPAFGRLFGVHAALMLQQLIYWTGKQADPDGWIYKSAEDWEAELTLSPREQSTARKKLTDAGVIEEKYQRLEHRMFFRILPDRLDELVKAQISRNDKCAFPESTKAQFGNRQKRSSARARQYVVQRIPSEITAREEKEVQEKVSPPIPPEVKPSLKAKPSLSSKDPVVSNGTKPQKDFVNQPHKPTKQTPNLSPMEKIYLIRCGGDVAKARALADEESQRERRWEKRKRALNGKTARASA